MKHKQIKYQGVQVSKPDNISMTIIKEIISLGGKNEYIPIQDVIDLLSRKLKHYQDLVLFTAKNPL